MLLHGATTLLKGRKARIHSHVVSRLQESAIVGVSRNQPSDELGVSMIRREVLWEDT